jgi:YVTN family beta-propeller protein
MVAAMEDARPVLIAALLFSLSRTTAAQVATCALFFCAVAPARPETLLVLSKGDHTLAMVDPSTRKVLARMPSGPDPHEVIASSDGSTAYISNYGGGAYNTITEADLRARKTTGTVDLGALRGPHGLAFVGGKLWFTAEAAKAIGSYDPASRKIDWIMGTGQNHTHMIFVREDLRRVITSNISSATLSIIDETGPRRDWEETVVPVGKGAEGFDVSPDGRQLWAANAGDGSVSVVDLASKQAIATIPAGVNTANRLKFTPDGRLVFVSLLSGPEIVVVDATTHAVVKRIHSGRGAAGIQMEPGGARAYVSCTPDNYVAVIDLKSLAIVEHIDAGKQPDGLAWVK